MPRKAILLLILSALSATPRNGAAQEPDGGPPTPVVLTHEAKVLLQTRVYHPPDFHPERAYTLIVGFHGYGASAQGFSKIARALAGMGFLVALPESGYPLLADGKLGFQWFPGIEGDEGAQRVSNLLFFDHMPAMLADLEAHYSIDRSYALGFSEGAVAALGTAIFRHEDFAGSIQFGLPLFSADWLPGQTLPDGKNVRLLFVHGGEDARAPLSVSEEAHAFFLEAGYDATLHVFDGGHSVPRDQLEVVADWIRQ